MDSQISIDKIIDNWKKIFHRMLICIYVFIVTYMVIFFLYAAFQKSVVFNSIVFAVMSISFYLIFFIYRKSQNLIQLWRLDFMNPASRLLQTIQMVSSQKLDLLPEEEEKSFTSDFHIKLVEVARGILEHQRFIDRVVDNMFEMMFLLNQDGVILKANKSACETTRYSSAELVGQHIRKLFPHSEGLVDYYLEIEIQFTTQGIVKDSEVFIQTSEGELLPFSINGVKIESSSGGLLGYTVIAKNQTETVRLINQLNRSNFDLGKANDELGKRYDQIKREIQEKEGQRRTLEMELATSQLVQKTFLPNTAPEHRWVDCSGTAIPAAFCGGDWWNTVSLDDKFYVFIADVTGHGTASAMVTAAVSGYFVSVKEKLQAGNQLDVDEILYGFDLVLTNMGTGSDSKYNMTCFCCVFDFSAGLIRFANAGHNFPLIVKQELKKIDVLVASGHRVGNLGTEMIEKKEIPLNEGDFVFFYTDGLIENRNEENEEFGKRRLRKFIEKNYTRRSSDFIEILLNEAIEFYGTSKPLDDDITIIAVKVKNFK